MLRSTPGAPLPLGWSRVSGLAADEDLVSVACRASLCIAVSGIELNPTSGISTVSRSTDGGATWSRPQQLPAATLIRRVKKRGRTVKTKIATRAASAVACEPTAACVIVGRGGGIWRSTDQGQTWKPVGGSPPGMHYRAVACPADGVCVLVGGTADLAPAETVVLRGTDARKITAPPIGLLQTIACESSSTCTAAGAKGSVASISAPWGTWQSAKRLPDDKALISLACPAANTCVGLTGTGTAVRTIDRSGGVWAKRPTGTLALTAVGCSGTTCAAVGDGARWYGSPSTGYAWAQVNDVPKLDVVTCAAGVGSGTCLAGSMEAIARSGSAGDFWTTPLALGASVVSCAGFPTCLAFSKEKSLASTDGGLTWHFREPGGSIAAGPEQGTCFDAMRCVAVGAGTVYTTFDGAQTAWHVGGVPTVTGEAVKAISCRTTTTCVLATKDWLYRGDMTMTDGVVRWSWVAGDAEPTGLGLSGVSCSSPSSCTAVGDGGQVWTTTDPALLHWTLTKIGPAKDPAPLLGVACPANGVCVAVGFRGYVATTTNNWETWSVDQIGLVRGGADQPDIKAVACQSATRCVLVGATAYVGTR